MRAVVLEGEGQVAVREVPDPRLEDAGDAIVRVSTAAICGSDLHFLHGKTPFDVGGVIGHECVGAVQAVGPGVTSFGPGDRVVAAFQIACGRCWFCVRQQSQLCDDARTLGAGPFGGGLDGAQAELVRVPVADANLLAVPDAVSDDRAIFIGDVLTTGFYAASLALRDGADTIAVLGCGPVGYTCLLSLQALGAERVVVLEPDELRRALARAAGADVVDPAARDGQMAIAELTQDRGADAVVEAVGRTDAFETALDLARRGGSIVIAGVYAGETSSLQLGPAWARALRLTFTGLCPVHAWWRRTMAEVAAGTIDPSPIISHRLPLDEAARGYALFDEHRATKVVLLP
jgi:2-desacetyl-2-hydroxyethyl bacteriochlorophyllide A dehydrogenase